MKLIIEIAERDLKRVMYRLATYDDSIEQDWDKIKEIPEVSIDFNAQGIEDKLGLSHSELEQTKFTYAFLSFALAKSKISVSDEEVDG